MRISTKLIMTFLIITGMIISILVISNFTITDLSKAGSRIKENVSIASDSSSANKTSNQFIQDFNTIMLSFMRISSIYESDELDTFKANIEEEYSSLIEDSSKFYLSEQVRNSLNSVTEIFDNLIIMKAQEINALKFIAEYKNVTLPKQNEAKLETENNMQTLLTIDEEKIENTISILGNSDTEEFQSAIRELSLLEIENIWNDEKFQNEKNITAQIVLLARNLISDISQESNIRNKISQIISESGIQPSELATMSFNEYINKINEIQFPSRLIYSL